MIKIQNLSKTFHTHSKKLEVLKNINLEVKEGEFLVIFGPNGCGKTTLLLILAGIEKLTKGEIRINNKSVESVKTGFVFQNYSDSLLPWRTALGNVNIAIKQKDKSKAESILKKIGFPSDFFNSYPYQLSSGMKQMIAIARALAFEPNFFLLDEPFSSLDYKNRLYMEKLIQNIWLETKKTTIFVSHDIDEAVFLADRIVVFSQKPTKIVKIIKVNLPRPRKIVIMKTKKFFEIRNIVLESFRKGLK